MERMGWFAGCRVREVRDESRQEDIVSAAGQARRRRRCLAG